MKKETSLIAVQREFSTEAACLSYLESERWPEGVRCLSCGSDKVSKFTTNETIREKCDTHGNVVKTTRVPSRQLYQCNAEGCRFQFSAKSGTIFDKSHLPLPVWFQAVALIVNAKKGISALQMQRDLGVNYRTAWFLNHRIREAMKSEGGLFDGTVEVDESYFGGRFDPRRKRAAYDKQPVMGMLQRGTKDASSQVQAFVVPHVNRAVVNDALAARVTPSAELFTDEHGVYRHLKKTRSHAIVIHSKGEYVRGNVHTNSIENFWSLMKRQIIGQHHFVSVKHLQRYLDECQFKFNGRTEENLFGMVIANLVIGTALRYKTLIGKVSDESEPSA